LETFNDYKKTLPIKMKNRLAWAYSRSTDELIKFILMEKSVANHVYAITFMNKSQMSVFIIASKIELDNASSSLWFVEFADMDYNSVRFTVVY
jgi:hypothetical protein